MKLKFNSKPEIELKTEYSGLKFNYNVRSLKLVTGKIDLLCDSLIPFDNKFLPHAEIQRAFGLFLKKRNVLSSRKSEPLALLLVTVCNGGKRAFPFLSGDEKLANFYF